MVRRLVYDGREEEKQQRARRHRNMNKAYREQLNQAVREIRADRDPTVRRAVIIVSARKLAEMEWEGIEVVQGGETTNRARKVLTGLWRFRADGMIRRLHEGGLSLRMDDEG